MTLSLDVSSPPTNSEIQGEDMIATTSNSGAGATDSNRLQALSSPTNGSNSNNGTSPSDARSVGLADTNSLKRYPGLAQEARRTCLRDSQFPEEQVVRLILQELRDRGFADTFEQLQKESGYTLEDEAIAQFRNSVLAGRWTEVEKAISSITIGIGSKKTKQAALFIIKRQQFLELLEARKLKQALLILQNELSTLTDDIPQLHRLSSLLMCPSPAELHTAADWDGSNGRSRFIVLESLQKYIPPGKMVPIHRMETLYSQAITQQCSTCEHHVCSPENNLYIDHKCPQPIFPPELQISLEGHSDEVWYVAFSPDGQYLASASRDKTCIIWSIADYSIVGRLEGHEGEVSYLAWSPSGKYIVSASSDKTLRLWDVETGETLQTFTGHTETVASCRWLGDNDRFISGGMDQKIIVWNTKGYMLKQIASPRVHDIAVSVDCSLLLVADDKSSVHMYDLATLTLIDKLEEPAVIMSLTLSSDARYCITELRNGELHMWDLESRARVREFTGHIQGNYVIRCAFAGYDDLFVAAGSEDGQLFVWNRNTGRLLTRLKGHTKTINGCSWSSKAAALATASDDKTISIWPAYHGAPSDMADTEKHTANTATSSMSSSSSFVPAAGPSDDDQSMSAAV